MLVVPASGGTDEFSHQEQVCLGCFHRIFGGRFTREYINLLNTKTYDKPPLQRCAGITPKLVKTPKSGEERKHHHRRVCRQKACDRSVLPDHFPQGGFVVGLDKQRTSNTKSASAGWRCSAMSSGLMSASNATACASCAIASLNRTAPGQVEGGTSSLTLRTTY